MFIKEAATKSGLSIDTIRYYEKEGMLPVIDRNSSGIRIFTPTNIEWLNILYWLRKTGMSMKVMKRYAIIVHEGDHTIPERMSILLEHQKLVEERRKELDACSDLLAHKVHCYKSYKKD
ncbi:MerR family transcriptional regulator [Lentilitoribacter sp. Alg239-R112]|jgi:DNA-binding transcriptional MerR regulator|uniref:MerR family transcriptional regulator n=1 Tax=Lentilitoribacter sp. Alg239-R112 TaxID=2305987 RepID=UPI0013A6FF99|nr:MerR family transcriptional regulator [Lentilitoribacter sp. Alg239-R112]